MNGSTFKTDYWNARILYELVHDKFAIIFFFVFERRKGPDSQNVKIPTQNRSSVFDMFHRIAIHDGTFFKFKRPSILGSVENNGFHAKVLRRNLCTQTGP